MNKRPKGRPVKVTDAQVMAAVMGLTNLSRFGASDLASVLKVTTKTARRYLARMVALKIVVKEGRTKGSRFRWCAQEARF
jgi:hypothetical protein